MGLRMRRSIRIAKGVRLNFGKSGVGLSFGTRGLRYSIHSSGRRTTTVGILGTGISYSTSAGGKRKYNSSAYNKRQQLQLEKQQQKLNEIEQNKNLVEEYNNLIEIIKGIHRECDEFVDWRQINALQSPFDSTEIGPNQKSAMQKYESFSPNFSEKIFKSLGEKRKDRLYKAIAEAQMQDQQEYEEWHSLNVLSEKIIQGDIDAYLQVIEEMEPFDDLLDFGSDFEVGISCPFSVEVEFRVKSETVVPNYVLSLTQTGKLSKKDITKTAYFDLVQDYVCSCSIRVARDLMALLPVDKVVIHAVDDALNTSTGFNEEVTILSVLFDREGLNRLNFERIDPSDALQNFNCNMIFLKTAGLKPVERISI